MAEAELLAELELVVRLVVQVQEEVQSRGRREWMRKIGVDHNNEAVHTLDSRPPLHRITVHEDFSDNPPPTNSQPPAFCLSLQELDVLVNSSIQVSAILDTSSQIVVIRHDIIQALSITINYQRLIEMEGANSATNWTIGCTEDLPLQVGDVMFKVHTHVIEHTSFGLLLGRPFQ